MRWNVSSSVCNQTVKGHELCRNEWSRNALTDETKSPQTITLLRKNTLKNTTQNCLWWKVNSLLELECTKVKIVYLEEVGWDSWEIGVQQSLQSKRTYKDCKVLSICTNLNLCFVELNALLSFVGERFLHGLLTILSAAICKNFSSHWFLQLTSIRKTVGMNACLIFVISYN